MEAIEKYQIELRQAQNKLNVALACKLVKENFEIQEIFEFETFAGDKINLFPCFMFSCGRLNISSKDIKHYIGMYIIKHDLKPRKIVYNILKAVKLMEQNESLTFEILA